MKQTFARGLALALTLGFIGNAHAVPIRFEFSGTYYTGERATGVFEIETDGLAELFFNLPPGFAERTFSDFHSPGVRPNPWTGSLAVGDQTFHIGDFPEGGYSGFRASDNCRPVCEGAVDSWTLSLYERSFPFPFGAVPPVWSSRNLSFTSYPYDNVPDLSSLTPESILTMPLGANLLGHYYEEVYDCSTGECVVTRPHEIQFVVDSVVRTSGSVSVPEPGTLALLSGALVGMFFLRRRKPALTQLRGAL